MHSHKRSYRHQRYTQRVPLRRSTQAEAARQSVAPRPTSATLPQVLHRLPGDVWQRARVLRQLQQQYGNQYVHRMVALARTYARPDHTAPPAAVAAAIQRARGGGQVLDSGVRAQMAPTFGGDFGGVRVQTKRNASPPGDIYEQEADQVAASLQRPAQITEHEEEAIQPAGASGSTGIRPVPGRLALRIQRQPAGGGAGGQLQPPYYISFIHVAPPRTPDHSQANPGPSGRGVDRAGYTRVRLKPRMTVVWDNLPPVQVGANQMIPIFVRAVNIFFHLDPIEVYVSSRYAIDSCPYYVTRSHEYGHVYAFLRIFRDHRPTMVARANAIQLPSQTNPTNVPAGNIEAAQEQMIAPVAQAVRDVRGQIGGDMRADRNARDAPAAYAQEYARCPRDEW